MLRRVWSNEIEKKAKCEFDETPIKREESLKHITEWLHENPHVNIRRDSLWLLNFIRGCAYNIQKTQNMLEAYAKLKDSLPEMVCSQDPLLPELQDIIKNGTLIPFGTPDVDCIIFRWETINPAETTFYNLMKVCLMLYEIFLNESETAMIVGHSVMIDCKELTFARIRQFPLSVVKKVLHHIFMSVPMNVKHFYVINRSRIIQIVYTIFRPLFPQHIQTVVGFYGTDYSSIFEDIPQHYFPKEYGGNISCVDDIIAEWKTKVESYRDWFLENENPDVGKN